ncbi:hypothetical protein [Litorisediminicola beolgyonensis]|uniref:NfeD-like C-terminal domain-containing protein n=1 Tax=Litorisediminicola beolgyonensis TaxID=1173614 RepID=A0ABW3ZFF6_9RHOB
MAIWTLWWAWWAAALLIALVEIVLPGFLFLGFAIGAALVGVFLLFGLTLELAALLTLFAVLSLVSWAVLRYLFRRPSGQARIVRHDIND